MFYDREAMSDLYESAKQKPHFNRLLITSQLFGKNRYDLTTNDILHLHETWKECVGSLLSPREAARCINRGNILILIHDDEMAAFKKKVESVTAQSSNLENGISTIVFSLTSEEADFLMARS